MAGDKGLKPIKTRRVSSKAAEDGGERRWKEEEQPLSPGARLFHAPQLNCCIVALIGCATKIDVEVIKEGLRQTLIKHPRFSSTLVFDGKGDGKPVGWVRTKVNIDNHIIAPDLDPNMDSPEHFIEDYVSNLTNTPMDLSKPLWELHVLNIKTSEANSLGIFRVHHSIGDGISLISLLLACTRKSSDPDSLPSLHVDMNKKKKPTTTNNSPWLLRWLLGLLFIFKVLWNTLVDLALFMATTMFMKDTDTPLKGAPGTERNPKKIVHRTLSLDDVKLVKNAMNTTINDVVLGITQAGLSLYLNRKYGEAKGDDEVQDNNLPNHLRLRATLLVNIRPSNTIQDLAKMMEEDFKGRQEWGNEIGYMILPFQIALRDDPLDYIRDAKTTIDKKKQSLEAQCTYSTAKFILNTLGLGLTASLTYRVLSNATMSFSNVVGPMEEVSFYGHPLAYLAPTVYGHPQALTIHFQSYMNKMTLVLSVDQGVIPDPHKLCDDIEESLKVAKNAVIERKLVK